MSKEKHSVAVATMADVIKKAVQTAADLNLDKAAFKDVVYTQCLPEGITAENVTAVRDTDAAFTAAATKVWGEHGVEAMIKDTERTSATAKFDMLGGVSAIVTSHRERVSGAPGTEPKTHHGDVTVAIKNKALTSDSFGFKPIRESLRELGAAKLAK